MTKTYDKDSVEPRCGICLWMNWNKKYEYSCSLGRNMSSVYCDFHEAAGSCDRLSLVTREAHRKETAKRYTENEKVLPLVRDIYKEFLDQDREVDEMDLESVIEAADKCRSEIVLCLLGAPGIGKTQAVYDFARRHDRRVVEIIASQILPNEVSGITMPVQETKSMEIFDHARLSSLRDGDILFFDELLQAAPSTLSACLTLIQERRLMSGKKLPDILIIAAANPQASASITPLSIRQRFLFYECEWDRRAWRKWIKDTLGYNVTDNLLASIVTEGSGMNVLTPRTATKLLQWIRDTDESETVYDTVEHMFGAGVRTEMQRTVRNTDPMQQIVRTVRKFYHDKGKRVETDGLMDCTPEKMMEMLTSLPEWDELQKVLSETEVK